MLPVLFENADLSKGFLTQHAFSLSSVGINI